VSEIVKKSQCSPLGILMLAFSILAIFLLAPAHATQAGDGGPLSLIITYRTAPAHRVALRNELERGQLARLQRWQKEGLLHDYRLLFNRYVDSASWDALALLTFPSHAAAERWKEIERNSPAGLTAKALPLVTSVESVPADLIRESGLARTSTDSVLMAIPYELLVSPGEYVLYFDGYVLPQLEGWMEEGVLTGYGMLLPRYYAGRTWTAMLILQYKDAEALGSREAVVAKVRARLKENAEWKAISDNKKQVREEKQAVIADLLAQR
jgi:hypothetical protein